jgi:hypothetical protein
MAILFRTPDWSQPSNNNGASETEIIAILRTANNGTGDSGLRDALVANSNQVTVVKGIHRDTHTTDMHITVDYLAGYWHVHLVETSAGGAAGYRVSSVSQWRS